MPEQIVAQARFDSKLRFYLYLRSLSVLAISVIGIVLLPIWIFAGWWWAKRYFDSLRCDLTEQRLRVHKGVIFQQDKTIPLDKIQDLSLRHGPIQRALGLCSLRVETAGQSSAQGQADAGLIGIIDVQGFQELVLAQRDLLESRAQPKTVSRAQDEDTTGIAVLLEIRDTLRRIDKNLGRERHIAP
jgi:putative membrane protein